MHRLIQASLFLLLEWIHSAWAPLFALVPAYGVAILAIWGVLPFTFFTEHAPALLGWT